MSGPVATCLECGASFEVSSVDTGFGRVPKLPELCPFCVRREVVDTLGVEHQGRVWSGARGGRWEWSDLNGWVVDGMATFGGHDPDGHGPFSEVVR